MKRSLIILLLLSSSTLCRSQCTRHGKSLDGERWSKQIRQVCFEDGTTANTFTSADGRKVLTANFHGFHLKVDGALIPWEGGSKLLTNESMVSWAMVFSFAQATVNDPCGQKGDFERAVVELDGDAIRTMYSEEETRRKFHFLLPLNMR